MELCKAAQIASRLRKFILPIGYFNSEIFNKSVNLPPLVLLCEDLKGFIYHKIMVQFNLVLVVFLSDNLAAPRAWCTTNFEILRREKAGLDQNFATRDLRNLVSTSFWLKLCLEADISHQRTKSYFISCKILKIQ